MRTETIASFEGIQNRSKLKGSPPGEVTSYFLSEEDRLKLIEKHGPIVTKVKHRQMFKPKD